MICDVKFEAGVTGNSGKLIVDGQDISEKVRSAQFSSEVGVPNRVDISLAASRLDLTMKSAVHIHVYAVEGYDVIEEPQPDGGKRWRMVKA